MAQAVFDSPTKKVYGETAALTTTASHVLFRPLYQEVSLYCGSDWRMGIAPKLARVKYYNASTYTDYTAQASDRDDTTHVPLDAMGTTHYLYMGFTDKVRGFYFNIDGANKNDNTATLDMEYCSAISSAGVGTFTDVASDSDGTTTGGDTLKQDGIYTFTLPAVVRGSLAGIDTEPLYWYRFTPSATLSATVDLIDIIPACDTTNYAYMESGAPYQIALNLAQSGALELKATAGTPTLNISWISH
jgi:hypothetical protein